MANGGEKNNDFYAVLGLNKECTAAELKNSYKKLALRWHPDRCSSSGNSKSVEEAKKKFQAIQQAYSVLSDANKRFLYDVGVYDSDDDENVGMGDFLNEMAVMMSQTKSNENGEETFEELKDLFEEMFPGDLETNESSSRANGCFPTSSSWYTSQCESSISSSCSCSNNKRNSTEMNYWKTNGMESSDCDALFQNFCVGVEQMQDHIEKGKVVVRGGIPERARSSRRHGRKQKVYSVSSNDYSSISAA